MSTLSGQTIQSTYPGLLKLANSSSGITSTYQAIEDGFGNNTNSRISTNGIVGPNILSLRNAKPDYGGNGFSTATFTPVAGSQNTTGFFTLYDLGFYAYSALTYGVSTQTTTSDVVNLAFYTYQQLPNWGIAPSQLIMSGITLNVASTGVKTLTLPSTLSFSGYGGGQFIVVYTITNSGVSPTVRLNSSITSNNFFVPTFGAYLNNTSNGINPGSRFTNQSSNSTIYITGTTFKNSYTISDLTYSNSQVNIFGFGLNVI